MKACGSVKNILGITNEPEDTPYKIGDQVYSNYQNGICWARSQSITNCKRNMERNYFEFIKIDKQNFPGLYKLIKDGDQNCNEDGKKEYYDKNRDGWLDPSEVYEIYEKKLKANRYNVRIKGEGQTVIEQSPLPGEIYEAGIITTIYLG